jgi:asparagine synthase (glutamine-hydrolysing)
MCGIAGIINFSDSPVNEKIIREMVDVIHHRGPDGNGFYFHKNVCLGHARLSIIDLSDAGAQPMHFKDKYVITYNGEVYNYIEIREELKSLGYNFMSSSDTEVILAAYDQWGEECVNRFNGMWAFAIHDKTRDIVFCSRDRFGIKPFYFYHDKDKFVFGSEIKQLLGFLKKKTVNKKILMDYLVLSLEDHNEETFFQGINKLLPSHNLVIDNKTNNITLKRYYKVKIDPSVAELGEAESIALWQSEFERSISYRLRSDVKVGTCLSGGLDSSSVAAVASEIYQASSGSKFSAITAESEDEKNNESDYAKAVVEKCNLEWHTVKPNIADFQKTVDDVIRVQEEPFGGPSIIMQYFVLKKAKEISSTVLLDGQGGDETLLGYERYYPAYLLSLPFKNKIFEFFNSAKNSKLSKKSLLLYIFYFTNSKVRIRRQLKRHSFIKQEYLKLIDTNLIEELSSAYSDIHKLQLLELERTQLPHLLKYEDRNSMVHSIETRLPFLDYKLVELSLSINNKFKIKEGWTKYILRKATEGKLPETISWRKNKFGFEAPTTIWLKDRAPFLKVIEESKILRKILSQKISGTVDLKMFWKLYNIARWEKIYNVEID